MSLVPKSWRLSWLPRAWPLILIGNPPLSPFLDSSGSGGSEELLRYILSEKGYFFLDLLKSEIMFVLLLISGHWRRVDTVKHGNSDLENKMGTFCWQLYLESFYLILVLHNTFKYPKDHYLTTLLRMEWSYTWSWSNWSWSKTSHWVLIGKQSEEVRRGELPVSFTGLLLVSLFSFWALIG